MSDTAQALPDRERAVLSHPSEFYIDGRWVEPHSRSSFDVIDPSSEELLYRVASADDHDMDQAIGAARRAFDGGLWPGLTHRERAGFLHRIADAVDRRARDLGAIQARQMGAVYRNAVAACKAHAQMFRTYADMAETFPFEERHAHASGGLGLLVREPVGVVGAIIPWNGPMGVISIKVAPALLAGCTVILKASPEAPGEAWLMAEIADDLGLPPGVLNVVMADREVSELLVRDDRVDKISFTGSTIAGRKIGAICGERVARVTLELGGKSAAIVLDDFDIDEAADRLTTAASRLNGQVCSALSRVIVPRARHDQLVDAMADRFSAMTVGDPFDASTQMGPLAMSRQRDRVEGFIAEGIRSGAQLATGGHRPANLARGFYIEPTVFGRVDNDSLIGREEIFGPVLTVTPAEDEAHAVDLANASIYGLNAAVFTDDNERAYRVARQLRSGTVGQNGFRADFSISFGGFKQSGVGREGGREGLLAFLEAKTVVLDGEYR